MDIIFPYDDNLLRIYEDAAFQVEGCLHTLAVLVIFFEPELKYSKVKGDFDCGTNIADYKIVFEKINNMKPMQVKAFMVSYRDQVDGGMSFLREAVVAVYKKNLPKFDVVIKEEKKKLFTSSLFGD